MEISTINFSKTTKLNEPAGQEQFFSLKKMNGCLSHQIAREIMSLLFNNVHEKISQKVKTDEILKVCARALFIICSRVRALQSCYMRMHSF